MHRPHRPFGVTLAIIASLLLFTVFPLMEVALLLSVRIHFSNVKLEGDGPQPFAMGTNFLGVPDSKIFLQAMIALIFLVIAIFAWRGRPAFMRYVLMIACAGLTLLNILNLVIGQMTLNVADGVSSLDGILNS